MDQVVIESNFMKAIVNGAIKKLIQKKLKGGEGLKIDIGDLEIVNDNGSTKGKVSIDFELPDKDLMAMLLENHIL